MLIIFDLDDTLINRSESLGPAKLKDALVAMIKAGMQIISIDLAFKQLLDLDKTCTSGKQTIQTFCQSYSQPEFQSAGTQEYYENIDPSKINIPLMPFANETIKSLKQQGHTIALVSHGVEEQQHQKIQQAGVDKSVFSQIYITQKKDKEIYYQKLMDEFNSPLSLTIVIGDSIDRDLLPAKILGIKTVHLLHGRGKHIQYTPKTQPSFSIKSLNELSDIIELCK